MRHVSLVGCLLLGLLLASCATIPVDERDAARAKIDRLGDETIAELIAREPELQKDLDGAVGYCVARLSAAKVVLFGGGHGAGVCYDRELGARTYLNVDRFDLGVGLGAGSYRALVVFDDVAVLREFTGGTWKSGLGAEAGTGAEGVGNLVPRRGYRAWYLSESGAVLAATARFVSLSVNSDLTDTGVSDISIPNTGFNAPGRQTENAPRQWDRALPFLAQKVIDEGYELPLPYGVGLTYANVKQDMILQELKVGLDGGELVPFDWVSFDNARAESESLQLKLDTWLFPFMNVFGLVGKLDGKAPIDVVLEGDGFLDELGINCTPPPPVPPGDQLLCNLLQGRDITLPITAPFSGTTYGLGVVLAGGWNNWFVTIPINATYADMDTTETDGLAYTVTPRVGRVINLGNGGNLALFLGGNYLRAELSVRGQVFLPVPGGDPLQVDYTIEQKNTDPWNLVVGGNWDITKRWSLMAEYNGIIGSRDAFISSLTRRF